MSEPYGKGGKEPGGDRRGRAGEGASRLPEELRALGRSLDGPGPDGGEDGGESMVERVLAQILAEQPPVPAAAPSGLRARLRVVRHWTRARRSALVAGLCGVLTVLVLTPPVRAAVADWFGFGGVAVRYDPSAVPSAGARVPGCGGPSLTLAEAERRAGFEPLLPAALGPPAAVTVAREPADRFLMTLCWTDHGHPIRLDTYPARLDVGFAKTTGQQPEWLSLDEDVPDGAFPDPALWFPRPHLLSFWLVDEHGNRFTRTKRTAGPTLLWTHGGDMTLRLEGVASKARAVQIAKSLK